jgi:hypothetical protein
VIKLLLLTPWRQARIVKFKPANEVITGQLLPIRRKFANDFEEPQRISANPPMISKSQALKGPGAMAAQYTRFHNVVGGDLQIATVNAAGQIRSALHSMHLFP